MMKWVLRRAIDKFERDWNYDASYVRDMIDVSPRAAWLFSRVTALGQFRRDLPIEAWCTAGITAVRHEDCGPCTQLAVTMAERAGVNPAVLRAMLADDLNAMPPDVALVWKFTMHARSANALPIKAFDKNASPLFSTCVSNS